jgi:integrase
MLNQRDGLPRRQEIFRLQLLLETAVAGSESLDAEIASAFHPSRNLLRKSGTLYWRRESDNGPFFERVPQYTRSLDAQLPHERAHDVKMMGSFSTRWRASCDGIARVDAATEVLARRLLALELIRVARYPKFKKASTRIGRKKSEPEVPQSIPEERQIAEDHRDIVISAMANEIERLSSKRMNSRPARAMEYSEPDREPARSEPTSTSPLISDLLEEWERHASLLPHSRANMRRMVSRFIDVNGDLPAQEIRRIHARELVLQLQRSPIRVPQNLKGSPLSIFIEYGKRHPEIPKLTIPTLNLYINYMSMLFNWAVGLDYLDTNPATGLRLRDKRPQAQKRLPYSIDDLKALFERAPIYTGHNATHRTRRGASVTRDGKFWLPLLALFTGARLSELMQLCPEDLKIENGVWFLDISKGASVDSLKTATSERVIPIHVELAKIGLVDFIQQKSAKGSRHIFDELGRRDGESLKVYGWSDSWRRIQKHGDFDHPKKSFHSFRHTFKDACRSADIREEIHDAFTGHAPRIFGRRYGIGIPLSVLSEHMKKLKYPGLDLSHLYRDGSDHV